MKLRYELNCEQCGVIEYDISPTTVLMIHKEFFGGEAA